MITINFLKNKTTEKMLGKDSRSLRLNKACFIRIFSVLIILFSVMNIEAATITSAQTGNWGTTTTWVGGVVPSSTSDVIIAAGHTVTVASSVTSASSQPLTVTVNSTGILALGTNTLEVSSNIAVNGSVTGTGTLAMKDGSVNSGTLSGGGTISSGTLTLDVTTVTITFTGSITSTTFNMTNGGSQTRTISAAANFTAAAMTINNASSSVTNSGTVNVTGSISINNASASFTNNGTISVTGNITGAGTGSTWTQGTNSTLNIGGTLLATGTLSAFNTGNTVNYNGTAALPMNNTSYHNLTLGGTRNANSITLPAASFNIAGNLTASATFTSGGYVTTSNTIVLNGSATQSINTASPFTFASLTINNTGTVPLNLVRLVTNDVTVNGTLTITKGNIDGNTNGKKVILPTSASISGAGTSTGWINGSLQKGIAASTTSANVLFPIGSSSAYIPVTLTSITTGSGTNNITASTASGTPTNGNPAFINQSARCPNYWTLTQSGGGTVTSYDAKFDYSNLSNTGTVSNYVLAKYPNPSAWAVTNGNVSGSTITANGLTSFSEFEAGEASQSLAFLNVSSLSACAGGGGVSLNGTVKATGAWTLTLSNGSTGTGSGNGTFSINVNPTTTTTYTIASVVDDNGSAPSSNLAGSVEVTIVSSISYGSVSSGDQNFGNSCIAATLIPSSMSVTGVTPNVPLSYQWYSQPGLATCPTGGSTTGWASLGSANGAQTATYTPIAAISASTTYACVITPADPNCGSAQWVSSCRKVTILNSVSSVSVTPASTICTGPFTFAAIVPSGSTYKWYDAASGGNILATNANYTPTLTTTTSAWAEASGTYSISGSAIPTMTAVGNSCLGTMTDNGHVFDITVATTLTSVSFSSTSNCSSGTQSATISLKNSSGATLFTSSSFNWVNGSVQTISLGWAISPGTGYRITASGAAPSVRYQSASTPSIVLSGVTVGAVTGGWNNNASASSTIYMYNLQFTAAGTCIGPRMQATATVIPAVITASAGAHGSISDNGAVNVTCSTNKDYTITADACYHIDQVLIDGVNNVSAVGSGAYTFLNVQTHHTIAATFALNTYVIGVTQGAHGTIAPDPSGSIDCDGSKDLTITPDAGYSILDVLIDGVSNAGAIASGTYTFTNVTDNSHTITASFVANNHTITATSGSNGSISPSGAVSVVDGGSQSFTFTADPCYFIGDVTVDGSSVGALGSYTFSNVTTDHAIDVQFVSGNPTITASAGTGGSISPNGNVSVTCGTDQSFTITPSSSCYFIQDVLIDGVSDAGAISSGTYSFTNVQSNHTISAVFGINYDAPPAISALGATTFCHGGSVTLSAAGTSSFLWSTGETTTTITVKKGGPFYATSPTGVNGCPTSGPSNSIVVTVNASPTAIITGDDQYCMGGSTALSAATSVAGCGTITDYKWHETSDLGTTLSSTSSYTATAPGNYKVVVTNSCGCVSTTCTP